MGIGGISATSLAFILLIVIIIFGTKKLRNVGKDLGEGVKGFREGMQDKPDEKAQTTTESKTPENKPSATAMSDKEDD